MAAAKYQQVFLEMLSQNQALFDSFRQVHDNYSKDPQKYQAEFNEVGEQVLDVVRRYENRLCNNSQNSGFGKFSTHLSDKFQSQVKAAFPKINLVGLNVS